MEDTRQLAMRLDLTQDLPDIGPMPEDITVTTAAEPGGPRAWEVIVENSFGKPCSYESIAKDPACAPERVFILRQFGQPVATASAQIGDDPTRGTVHMVGTNRYYAGNGAGLHAVYVVLKYMKEHGVRTASLLTDDFRLPAIAIYKRLGFEPVAEDESMRRRWAEIDKKLAAYHKSSRKVLPLWPGREAPYSEMSPNQAQPSIACYPVENSRGAVVVCPGGGYAMKAGHEGAPIARMINEAGVSAYVLDYRVAPCHREAPLSDAKRAIRVVRSMGYEKVAILGFSAGGNLTCCAATLYDSGDPDAEDPIERLSSRPDAFVPCYAVVSLGNFGHDGTRKNLLGAEAENPELVRHYSAECNVTPDTPTAFLWHTATDEAVPVENSLMLASAMARCGVPFEMHIFPKGRHGLGLAQEYPDVTQWISLVQNWLVRLGYR
ncbi:MAG: GNAT family N-acetyltransferase [Eubacteriales bacterium]|nr:GNAT family N-acetyltransferase [Eubacteriales bacterium]